MVSAHRTPERLFRYGREAEGRGLELIIAGAGGAAHLPGMLAAITILPVLGVPVESKVLKGVDSLLSIVQMPRGVPVGTLAIGASGAANAALLAAAILARKHPAIREALADFRAGADRRRGRVARMSAARIDRDRTGRRWRRRVVHPPGVARRDRQRPARPDVHPGGAADGLPGRRAQHHRARRRPRRWPTGRSSARPTTCPALRELADRAEAITVEFENVSAPALRWLARRRIVRPGWRTRLGQPEPAPREDVPRPPRHPARPLAARADRRRAERRPSASSGLPLILKTAASGYDGKGQVLRRARPTTPTPPGRASAGRPAWPRLGRVRRRGLGGRRPRARRPGGRLSRRPEPARAAHPRRDVDARAGRADRRAGGARRGLRRRRRRSATVGVL